MARACESGTALFLNTLNNENKREKNCRHLHRLCRLHHRGNLVGTLCNRHRSVVPRRLCCMRVRKRQLCKIEGLMIPALALLSGPHPLWDIFCTHFPTANVHLRCNGGNRNLCSDLFPFPGCTFQRRSPCRRLPPFSQIGRCQHLQGVRTNGSH